MGPPRPVPGPRAPTRGRGPVRRPVLGHRSPPRRGRRAAPGAHRVRHRRRVRDPRHRDPVRHPAGVVHPGRRRGGQHHHRRPVVAPRAPRRPRPRSPGSSPCWPPSTLGSTTVTASTSAPQPTTTSPSPAEAPHPTRAYTRLHAQRVRQGRTQSGCSQPRLSPRRRRSARCRRPRCRCGSRSRSRTRRRGRSRRRPGRGSAAHPGPSRRGRPTPRWRPGPDGQPVVDQGRTESEQGVQGAEGGPRRSALRPPTG